MSLKNLFGKKSITADSSKSINQISSDIESPDYILEYKHYKDRFVPNIDFEDPQNFSRYASAEKYYQDSIKLIYLTYPYDGSFKEKLQWHNNSSDLTNYFFDNVFPRQNGYINIGEDYGSLLNSDDGYYSSSKEEYIKFNGTFNSSGKNSKQLFEKSNKLDLENYRGYNLSINGQEGITTEFYFKKENLLGSEKQVILDIWNSDTGAAEGRFRVEIHPGISGEEDKFYITLASGSDGVRDLEIGQNLPFIGEWHHYAITAQNSNSSLKVQLFLDGDLVEQVETGTSISQVYGAMNGHIGSLITAASGSSTSEKGWAKLSGSLDEFRFWKTKRTDKEISRNYFLNIGGGTNTDKANTKLGIYYKFNEGIFSSTNPENQYDKNVIDYSGRISNGTWIGISQNSRNINSAIVEGGFSENEFKDPILYSQHPDLLSVFYYYTSLGREYDQNNNSLIYNTIPSWMAEEDENNGKGLKDLTQIMGEFFDDMQNKLEMLPEIKNIDYENGKPSPFTKKLLENTNFESSNLFLDSSILELYYNRNETQNYEEELHNIKNSIYKNIYNNLINIYKSKGTSKSYKNLLRCFGLDENLIKLNVYANDTYYTFDDRFEYKTEKKKYINFNHPDRFVSTVYQSEELGNANSLGYLPGSNDLRYFGSTMEAEVIFPEKFDQKSIFYFSTPFVTSSLFGMHQSNNGTWQIPDRAEVCVFAVKEKQESRNVKFCLSSSCFNLQLETPIFKDVYSDQKWNFAVSLRHEKYPHFSTTLGSDAGDYILEFYGVNTVQDIKQESFLITSSVPAAAAEFFFQADKMIYMGAHREDYEGSVVISPDGLPQNSDVKISSVRYWNNYIENDIIDLHSKDVFNFGNYTINGKIKQNIMPLLSSSIGYENIKDIDTLCLNWDFDTVSSSSIGSGIGFYDGEFLVEDSSSGSLDSLSNNTLSQFSKYQFTGKGAQFPTNSENVVSNEYLYSAKRRNPEVVVSDDMIKILSEDDEYNYKDAIPVVHYFSIEKNMYSILSDEIIKWMGTIKELNNLIGNPKYRYEEGYKELENLRTVYFNYIQNEPDVDNFNEFFKWVDSAISTMIEQIIPGSMNYSSGVFSVIESHILERNKYRHKLPTIEFKGEPPIGPARSVNELLYNWKTGHAPVSGLESDNCNWWKNKAERTGSLNEDRKQIFDVILSTLNRKFGIVYNIQSDINANTFEKKRETEIIRREIGFDLSGNDYYEFTDMIKEEKDCDDE